MALFHRVGFQHGRRLASLGLLILCVVVLGDRSACGQSGSSNASEAEKLLIEEQAAFRSAAAAAAGAVVQIETFGGLERVGQELISDGPTTGTVVAEGGWIISSLYSFRQQPASILVSLPSGKRVAARIVARDTSRELALLKLEEDVALPVPKVAPINGVRVGQWTIALGRTFEKESVSQSVGIISALGRAYGKAVQTDAKVSPVNYGGPLVDIQGRVIGVLAPISPGAILEGDSSQLYDSGIGFAVPLEDILARLPQLQTGKDVSSGKLGVVVADQNELAGPVKVAGAAPGSPAAKAGLKPGDVIVEAAGKKVTLLAHLKHALGPCDAGSEFSFVADRKGKRVEFNTTLVDEVPTYRLRYLGMDISDVAKGVRIEKVWPNSPAAAAKLTPGNIVTMCDETTIRAGKELRQQVAIAELDRPLKLSILQSDAADKPSIVEITPVVWPLQLDGGEAIAAEGDAAQSGRTVEESELALGDFPNKAVAWVPVSKSKEKDGGLDGKLGLLIILPEPGELNRKAMLDLVSPIVKSGWIVTAIASGDPKRWSAEEVELVGRVITQLNESYSIDSARTVVGGMGAGARMALIGGRAAKGKVVGVIMMGTATDGIRVQRENTPLESLHFLLIGSEESYRSFLQQLTKFGFPAMGVPVPELSPSKWETVPFTEIRAWLAGIGRI